MKVTQNYNILDITKFIMAFLVVTIHIPISPSMPMISHLFTNAISRMGVPFFFICSGFLFFKKENASETKILLNTLKRILILFIGWTIFYALVLFFTKFIHMESHPFQKFLLFLFRHIFLNPFAHLWFLPALIIGVIMSWAFIKFKLHRMGLIVSVILFTIGVLGDSYYNLAIKFPPLKLLFSKYYPFFTTTRNGIFFGFPLIYWSTQKIRWNMKMKSTLTVVFFITLVGEYFIVKENQWTRDYNMYFSILPFSIFFFHTLMNLKINISNQMSIFFREYSLGLYLLHPFWLYLNMQVLYIDAVALTLIAILIIKKMKTPVLYGLLK